MGGQGGRRFRKQHGGQSEQERVHKSYPVPMFIGEKSVFSDDLKKGISMTEQLRLEKEEKEKTALK